MKQIWEMNNLNSLLLQISYGLITGSLITKENSPQNT